MKFLAVFLLAGVFACAQQPARAGIVTKTIEYKDGNVTLEGYLAYDDAVEGKRPAVLIVHAWNGLGPYVQGRARQIAGLGYAALALDIYGKGVRPSTSAEAAKLAAIYRNDRALMRRRAEAGLAEARRLSVVDPARVAAIGYCFGGGVALELARAGADIQAVVTFHGSLDTPHPEDARNIKAKILVLAGANDPYVTQDQVIAFWNEMRAAKVDWQLNVYANAVHSFTDPAAGDDPAKGAAYNREADMRSWEAMKTFLAEIFK
jgi:dienelactone hydrolase